MTETVRPTTEGAPPDPLIGQTIGGAYRITRIIGSGGMGNVYEASHVRLPKRFAVKVVRGELAKDEAAFERFKREAEIASSLGNKHIVEVLDFNILPDGSPYMVMEYLTGEDLATRLGRQRRLGVGEASQVLGQVVSALEAAHAQGIVHRDIKPENIFLTSVDDEADFVKLLDFGLSKIRGAQKRLTANLSVLGTPWYMSPEQARGDSDLDHRTDIYALAVVLYQVLCGRVPFEGENVYGVLTQIATQPPPPILSFAPDLPREVELVLQKALAKEPNGRYPLVREFWEAAQSAMGLTVVRRSIPSARVHGPAGEPFRVPTPSQLQVGGMPTISTSQGKISADPIPLTSVARQGLDATVPSRPAINPESPSMIMLQRAAFPQRSSQARWVALGIGAALLVAALGFGIFRVTRPATPETTTTVVAPPPEPSLIIPAKVPEPAVSKPVPPVAVEPPKPAVVPAAPKPEPAKPAVAAKPEPSKPQHTGSKPKPSGKPRKGKPGGELIDVNDIE